MMGRKCGVKGCLSESQRAEDRGVTFHKVPFHPDIRPKWLQLCQIFDDKKVIYVCSRHFLRADFCNFKGKKYMLKQGVLPSIFAWNKPKPKPSLPQPSDMDIKLEIKTENISDVIEGIYSEPSSNLSNTEIKDELHSPNNTTTIEQKIKTVDTSTGQLTFLPNARIEALDFNQTWQPATIIEVDYEENEILVHFDTYSSKYDEWICTNSSAIRALSALRPSSPEDKNPDLFREGERCMASWSDARKFPATVTKVLENNTYEVLFDDGYVKTLKGHRMSKSSSTSPQSSPLFQPVSGTKEDRRNKKRKLNVSSLFGKKRPRAGSQESTASDDKLDAGNSAEGNREITEWYPSWKGDKPIGTESFLFMGDSYRKSIIVPDPRLPANWEKHMTQRPTGNSAGKWDTVIVSPEGKKLRIKSDVKLFIEENPQLNLHESMFDFLVYKKRVAARKRPSEAAIANQDKTAESRPASPAIKEAIISGLKIIQVDGGYKCPIEGCGKNFRRENLAQMHVKHYHPKYTKFLDSTPNVADLAYARTVGESLDRSPGPEKSVRDVRVNRTKSLPRVQPKQADTSLPTPTTQPSDIHKDSEIIKLLNSKPFDSIKSLESSKAEPLPSGLPPSMYPDIKLKDLLVKSEAVPKNTELNLKTLSSSTCRPTGLKTLLPVKKEEDVDLRQSPASRHAGTRKESRRRRVPLAEADHHKKEVKQEPVQPLPEPVKVEPVEPSNIIIEGGEVIKIVRMKQEEIINCTCGITEEDGLMIQCELCLCWQHAYCNNIQKENEVPEKYICYICQHPAKQRSSKKYMHDQDWLKHGVLPAGNYHCNDEEQNAKRFEKLKVSHDLSGGLHELKDFMNSMKVKIKIAEAKNHPKLYLWSKPWDRLPLPEHDEIKKEIKEEEPSKSDCQSESMLMAILKSDKDGIKVKDEIPEFPKIDINSLIQNNLEALNSNIPQPEAAIESADCRLNLLDHIAHCQNLIEERLDNFEKQINDLDPLQFNDNDEHYSKIRQTTSMLMRDLNVLKELSQITTF